MTSTNQGSIRDAVASDAENIARVHVDAWREAYSGVLADHHFSDEALGRRQHFWGRYLSLVPRTGRTFVAERDGALVGFANSGEARGPDAEHGFPPARALHLCSIYLIAAAHGSGLGQSMLDAVLGTILRNCGCFAAIIERSRSTSATGSLLMALSSSNPQIRIWSNSEWCDEHPPSRFTEHLDPRPRSPSENLRDGDRVAVLLSADDVDSLIKTPDILSRADEGEAIGWWSRWCRC